MLDSAALFRDHPLTKTKAGWCLQEGIHHVSTVDNGRLAPLIARHGVPTFYRNEASQKCRHAATQDVKDPQSSFQSLVRIVAGQFVSGQSAQAAWKRLLQVTNRDLTPSAILALVAAGAGDIEANLQKPAGLTKAKAACVVSIAEHFCSGQLSEERLTAASSSQEEVRAALLKIKGIGPWSCDMFLLFYLERSNVLPLGDLGVRKGLQACFAWRGSAPKGKLCLKKDAAWIEQELAVYQPYQSLLTYYMWRAADTPLAVQSAAADAATASPLVAAASATKKTPGKKRSIATTTSANPETPTKQRSSSKRLKRIVTP